VKDCRNEMCVASSASMALRRIWEFIVGGMNWEF
jgi:hypothetical protein